MARTTKRSFWSFITRRRGTSPRPAPTFTRLWRRLSLERLEGRALPSVSFGADPGNPGKSIVSFNDDTTDGVNLQLRLSNGQLQYRWGNSGNYSTDLNTATSGIDALSLSQVSKIVVTLNAGDDTLTLDNTNGSVIPVLSGIAYDGGTGIDTLVYAQAADMFLTDTSLMVTGFGTVALTGVERANLTCGNFGNSMDAAGFSGDVTLIGGNGKDELTGGTGNDAISGLNGADVINGGPGNDTLDGGTGTDTLTGGQGNDTLTGGLGGDTLDGGTGTDTLAEQGDVNFTLTNASLTGLGTDLLVSIDRAELTGGAGANTINAAAFTGDTVLNGLGGNDTLTGGLGNDILTGGLGNDTLDGGTGTDTVAEQGDVNFTLTNTSLAGLGTDLLVSIDRAELTGGAGPNTLNASAFTGNATLIGGAGPDVLVGGSGDDRLTGGGGQNTLTGGPGIDTVVESDDGNFALSDTLLTFGLASDALSSIEKAELTGKARLPGPANGSQFTLSGWTGDAMIEGADAVTNTGSNVQSISAADFSSFLNTGDNVRLIALNGAEFDTLVNSGDYVAKIELTGAKFDTLVNSGDGAADATLEILLTGAEFDTLISSGDYVAKIELTGAKFDTLVSSGDGDAGATLEILLTGAEFDTLISSGDYVATIELTGAKFDTLVSSGDGDAGATLEILLTGAEFDTLISSGDYVAKIELTGAKFDTLVSSGDGDAGATLEILLTGAEFDTLINSGDYVATIELTGAKFDTLVNDGDNVTTITLDGADFGQFTTTGTNVTEIIATAASFETITIGGSIVSDVHVSGDGGPNALIITGSGVTDVSFSGLGGDDVFAVIGTNVTAVTVNGGLGNDTFYVGGGFVGLTLVGGTGDDRYFVSAATSGHVDVVEGYAGAADPSVDTLDFSGFTPSGIALDLTLIGSQTVAPGLTFTLSDAMGIENVVGTAQADTILGNDRNNLLLGADQSDDRYGAPAAWNGRTQVVVLDFDTFTNQEPPGELLSDGNTSEHFYTDPERQAIKDRLSALYAGFHVDFRIKPAGGTVSGLPAEYATIYFNRSRFDKDVNGDPIPPPQPGGESSDVDFRNTYLGGTATVQVNGLLGGSGQPDAGSPNFIAASSWIAGHELGHLLGLRHSDAFGPIGFGIHSPPGTGVHTPPGTVRPPYIPSFPGPAAAFETNWHMVASPAITGFNLDDLVSDTFFGEREAVKLAFAISAPLSATPNSLFVSEDTDPHGVPDASAQSLDLYSLAVPNTLHRGVNANKAFNVSAAGVQGSIGVAGQKDVYAIQGRAGDLLSLEVLSESLIRNGVVPGASISIDSVVTVYNSSGQVIATNDDQFEPHDSTLIDVVLPADGTYYIEVRASVDNPLDTGDYELFVYRFDTANVGDQGDVLSGRGGDDRLIGGDGNDTLAGGLDNDTLAGGTGTDTLAEQGDVNFTLTNTSLTGLGTDALTSIDRAELTGGAGPNTLNASAFTGDTVLNGLGGNDTLTGGLGNDILTGGLGNDTLAGGSGTDTLAEQGDVNFTLTNTSLTGLGTDALTSIDRAELTGGAGANTINASAFTGNATLIGGAGDDTLTGSAGTNILIGGTGLDTMSGSANKDILIAGYTIWDTNYTALRAILAEWASSDSHAVRVGNIGGPFVGGSHLNGTYYLNATTVFTDASIDKLSGSGGVDWYFVDLNDLDGTPKDKITGNTNGSTITGIFPPP